MQNAHDARAEFIHQKILKKFGSIPLLIRVNVVSEILGVPSRRLYDQIRTGKFFLPYRLINRCPMVEAEDLISWYSNVIEPFSVREDNAIMERDVVQGTAGVTVPRQRNSLRRMMDDELAAMKREEAANLRKCRR
nr:hypothetical protein [Herbaspirillum sp. B39]